MFKSFTESLVKKMIRNVGDRNYSYPTPNAKKTPNASKNFINCHPAKMMTLIAGKDTTLGPTANNQIWNVSRNSYLFLIVKIRKTKLNAIKSG